MPERIFVSGIHTGVGKTIVSAVLAQALEADYWKPVQTGTMEGSDTETVKRLVNNPHSRFHPEQYALREPLSPHAAAALENVGIQTEKFSLPVTSNHLIIEGAGGLMVPITEDYLMIHLIRQLEVPVVLVSRNYLGSINHTLMSVAVLQKYDLPLMGIIFSGAENPASESVILSQSGAPMLGRVGEIALTPEEVTMQAERFTYLKTDADR